MTPPRSRAVSSRREFLPLLARGARDPARRAPARRGSSAAAAGGRLAVVVAVVTFVAFLPTLQGEFVTWDDNRNFLDNPHYRGLAWEQLRWMWTTFHMGHYVPLAWMTLGFDYALWGMNPAGYHLHNLLLHVANALLVYAIARRLLGLALGAGGSAGAAHDPAAAPVLAVASAVAALLFAVHPLRVESVAWITERRDVLSLLFFLLAVLAYLRHAANGAKIGRWYALTLAAFVCALLSKGTAVTLPAVLLILNVYPLRRLGGEGGLRSPSARRVYAELAPLALLAAAFAVIALVALRPSGELDRMQLPPFDKVAVSAYGVAFYLWKTVAPSNLAPLYEMPRNVDPLAPRYVMGYAVATAVTGAAWLARRRSPGIPAALAAFLVIVFPMLGIVQNGPQIAADRYTYHAAPALALLAGGIVAWGWQRRAETRAVVAALALVAVTVLGVLTWRQTLVWRDSERLWSRVLQVDSTSSIAHIAMGDLMIARDQADRAAHHYRRGVVYDPTYAEGHNNLGVALARQGRLAEAIESYRRAVALDSAYADAHNNWGIALSRLGEQDAAMDHFRSAITLVPTNADARVNLGNALLRSGRPEAAIDHYRDAAAIRPGNADTHLNWGVALAQLGWMGAAIEQFRRALAIDPEHREAQEYLGRARALEQAGGSPRRP